MSGFPGRAGGLGLGAGALGLALFAFTTALSAGESVLTVADLAAYRAALSDKGSTTEPPVAVDFPALWAHPEKYKEHRVQVQGRIVRRFRQGSFGAFPPLEEAWLSSPAGNPFCVVFPAAAADPTARAKTRKSTPTDQVTFAGTFLKLIEYKGGDGPRLAPLIVGPAPPALVADQGARPTSAVVRPSTRLDGTIALAAALLVALVLVVQHARRPLRRPLNLDAAVEPPPLFDDAPAPGRLEEGRDSCPV
jgi:hypothetical protein